MISYLPNFMPNKILIIGAGGTGSRIVPLLGQFLKTCAWILNPEITIIDDDIVEEKNLLRQNFIAPDVGKHKAIVLATRYSKAFNIPIIPYIKRVTKTPDPYSDIPRDQLETEKELNEIFLKHIRNSIIILCVDSPEARQHIVGRIASQTYNLRYDREGSPTILLLDSGNENDFGQVSVSTFAHPEAIHSHYQFLTGLPNGLPVDQVIPAIPVDMNYFRTMTATSTPSCADLDQTMAINTMMAVTMFGIIQNFYYAKPINFHRLNVTLSGTTPEYITPSFLWRTICSSRNLESNLFGHRNLCLPISLFNNALQELRLTYENFKIQMHAAETKQKAIEDKKAAQEKKKIEEAAVKAAMKLYGWVKPTDEFKEVEEKETIKSKKAPLLSPNWDTIAAAKELAELAKVPLEVNKYENLFTTDL